MDNNRLPNIHPGEILRLEFLEPLDITPYRLSKDIGVAQTRISEILSEKRSITADTALRLSHYFGNSPQFWLNLQTQYDLRQAQEENKEIYKPPSSDGFKKRTKSLRSKSERPSGGQPPSLEREH